MIHRILTARLLATTAIMAGIAAPAAAQTEIGEVIVTARRVEERLQDVPISITVFNQQQLTQQNVFSAADLVKFTPSLSSSARYGPEKASFAIRGFTQDTTTSPSVGVYFADVVGPRQISTTTGGNGAGPGAFFDLQNVQVLKGPQGTLFGRNTTGGAILLVPQKPTDQFEGYLEGSYGNYDMYRLQGVVNVPIAEKVRFRAGFDRMKRDGIVTNHSGVGPGRFTDVDYYAVRASLLVDLTPDLENYSVITFSHSNPNGTLPHIVACIANPLQRNATAQLVADAGCAQVARQNARGDGFLDVESNTANPQSWMEQWQFINTTTWRQSKSLTIKNIFSYSEYQEKFGQNVIGDNLFLPATLNLVVAGVIRPTPTGAFAGQPYNFASNAPYPGKYSISQRSYTEELQAQGVAFDDRLNWQAGAYTEMSQPLNDAGQISSTLLQCSDLQNRVCRDVLGGVLGRVTGSANARISKNFFYNYALYAQGTYKLSEEFSLTAGLRRTWDRNKAKGAQMAFQFAPAPGVPAGGRTTCSNLVRIPGPRVTSNINDCWVQSIANSHATTWMVDLEYRPIENVMFWVKNARGYRQGLANVFAPGFEITEPEKVDSYEVGAKTSFGGPIPGYFNVTAFYNKLNNQQLQANATARIGSGVSPTQTTINAGKSKIQGVEVDAGVRPAKGVTIDVGYAYLDTRLNSFSPPDLSTNPLFSGFTSPVAVGSDLVFTPRHKVSVNANYALPVDPDIGEVTVGAVYTYTSTQSSSVTSAIGRLPATNILNLNLNWRSIYGRPIDLGLFATNVTNDDYPILVSGSIQSIGIDSMVPGEPRTYGVRLRYRFGG